MKQIKYFYTTLWLLLSTTMLSAAEMSERQAMEQARQFMLQVSKNSQTARTRAIRNVSMTTTPTGLPELYAFNIEGGGYVIASADDRTLPVLGYSLTGRFDVDRIPDNMRAWLQGYAEQIRMLGNAIVTSTTDSDPSMTAIEPLVKTHWGQREPYNLQTPIISDNQHAATGCAATAMAQVMYYHQWPKTATGVISAYTYQDKQTQEYVDMKGLPSTTFQWDKMQTSYTEENPGTEEQRQAVAELMRYCGQASLMKYGLSSGASIEEVANALQLYFGYSKSARIANRGRYDLESWKKLIWNELNQKRPVYFSGFNGESGHAFVVDGYDNNGLFHVNWGWNGDSDNYFAIDVLNPNSTTSPGASSSAGNGFIFDQKVMIGVEPSTGDEEVCPVLSSGLILYKKPYVLSGELAAEVFFFDMENKERSYDLALGTKNTDGTVNIIHIQESSLINSAGMYDDFSIASKDLKLSDGTYQLYGFYKETGVADDTWHQLGGDKDYWGVTVNGSEMTFFFDVKLKITKAYLEGDHQAPLDDCTLVLEVENEGDDMVATQTILRIGKTVEEEFKTANVASNTLSFLELQPKAATTLRYPIQVPFKGEVEIRLCGPEGDYGYASATVTVDKEPHFYDIQLVDYKVEYKAGEKDLTKAVNGTLWLKNNDTRTFFQKIISRIGNDGRENGDYDQLFVPSETIEPGEIREVGVYLEEDLKEIKEPTDLHLVVVIDYPEIAYVKLLDIIIKSGTTVTPNGTTAISTVTTDNIDPDASYYDLQGRRVMNPTKGVYIVNGRKVLK